MKETTCTAIKILVKCLANYSVVASPWADSLGDLAESAAKDWWEQCLERRSPADRATDLQDLAQATPQEIRNSIQVDLAAISDPALRARIETYVSAIPGSLRASMRRPSDPTGRTVPAGLVPRAAADLMAFMPTRLPRFSPGDRPLGIGDLELVELLGTGGFGEVWLARNPHMPSQQLALKFCLDAKAAVNLRAETSLLARLQQKGKLHPGVVPLLHTFLSADPPCLAYEYVPGATLASVITTWHRERGAPTAAEAARVILRIAEVMASCHQQDPPIVHRDLKPANILVESSTTDPEASTFRVTDFGIGGLAQASTSGLSRTGVSPGNTMSAAQGSYSPLYASPDQMAGKAPTPADDVYSLGVIWWQLLEGNLSAGAPSGSKWMAKMKERGASDAMVQLLSECLEPNGEDRIKDAGVLVARLGLVLGGAVAPPLPRVAPTLNAEQQALKPFVPTVQEIISKMVKVSDTYSICAYQTTQGWYQALMGHNPSYFNTDSKLPVDSVSREDALKFCAVLIAVCAAFPECRIPERMGFNLPTSAQWENAFLAGGIGRPRCRYGILGILGIDRVASWPAYGAMMWGPANSFEKTHPVGQLKPNAWSIFDMGGNVREWCLDVQTGASFSGDAQYRNKSESWYNERDRYGRYHAYGANASGARGEGFRVTLAKITA
jgi:serine/threonine protein kinase